MAEIVRLPLLPLRGLTVFPEMRVHFDLGRDKSIKALDSAMNKDQLVFLVAQKDLRNEEPALADLYPVGTMARVRQVLRMPGDNMRVLVEGVSRARLKSMDVAGDFIWADVQILTKTGRAPGAVKLEAGMRQVRGLFESYASLQPRLSPEVLMTAATIEEPGYLADYVAQSIPVHCEEKQVILEETSVLRRLERVAVLLMHEVEVLEIEQEIHQKVRDQVGKNQRDYYLREQIKTIQGELGEGDDVIAEAEEYQARILALKLPEETENKLMAETKRLSRMSQHSPEMAVIRTYLDTCLELPWKQKTKDRVDIAAAKRMLDADHYGIDKVKERILEYLAVKRLAPDLKGQILCLVGPPGVGKTSVAQSFARAMGRKMARLSLGGVRDEADIRGHRKTYIGAMPGRIINAVRQAGSSNPVIVLDEIDKMGHDFRGDPAAALLEVLDPEQNAAFRDHYLEVVFDVSDVLFVTTANTTETIPRALLDRMEVIEMTSYTDEEKMNIAQKHLLPKLLKKHGLTKAVFRITSDALRECIAGYTRESGVRRLERELAAIARKAAKLLAEGAEKKVVVNAERLPALLGVRKYKPERRKQDDEVGVVSGLAWTRVGGEILEVEVGVVEGTGKIELTGNLGDVMKESARAALTYIRSRSEALQLDADFYKNRDIHIHFPEGAIPKDGPSAGITMACAIVSALTDAPVRRDVAMTGEITLRGRVLPIGGLKEKTMAAFRAGVKTVIIPAENEQDLQDIDPTVRGALQFVTADHMDAVLANAIDFSRRPSPKDRSAS